MKKMPEWLSTWISKDRLVRNKYKISQNYLKHSKRIKFIEGEKDSSGKWKKFHYIVYSPKYGHYHVRYEKEVYHCNCPFFKHRLICSHILGVCQKINVWPLKESILSNE